MKNYLIIIIGIILFIAVNCFCQITLGKLKYGDFKNPFANVYLVGNNYEVIIYIPLSYHPNTPDSDKKLLKAGYDGTIKIYRANEVKNNTVDYIAKDIPINEFWVIYRRIK